MEKNFKFKVNESYGDAKVYTASYIGEDKYLVEWEGCEEGTKWSTRDFEYRFDDGIWIKLEEEKAKYKFVVRYFNDKLEEISEKSFDKKKEALLFIEAISTLIDSKDIKLFKTKEIPLSK